MKQNQLKQTREVLRLSQKEIAERVGVAVQVYQRYEYGERLPRVDIAIKIANVLNETVETLFLGFVGRD